MEKIDTDYKEKKLKSLAKLPNPFNRDITPLKQTQSLNRFLVIFAIFNKQRHVLIAILLYKNSKYRCLRKKVIVSVRLLCEIIKMSIP